MNKRKKQLLCCLVGSTLVLSVQAAGFANQSDSTEYNLDEYIVTASRIPVKLTETAANATVITREEIEKGNFSSVPEILRKTNIAVEEESTGALPVLNGDPRVLILVDGRRMNWDQVVKSGSKGGINLNTLSVANIERIEIVRGPASSLYGSDAVGGVINIITRKATGERTTFSTEMGSWGMHQYNLSMENKLDNGFSYLLTAGNKNQDDYEFKEASTGKIKRFTQSHYDENYLTLRLDQELQNNRSLSLQIDHNDRSGGFNWTMPGYSSSDWYYYPDGHTETLDNNISLTYQADEGNLFRLYKNYSKQENTRTKADYSVTRNASGAEWQRSLQLNDTHTLVGGAEWRKADFEYPTQGIDNTYFTKALFLEDHWKLANDWTLTLGSRFDDHSIIGNHVTSRVTANRKLNQTTNAFISWGQFIKAPLIEDMFSNNDYMEGNPNLRPETGDTVTLGINTELNNGAKLQASVFSSQIKDAINYVYGNGSTTKTKAYNMDEQKRQGLDISLSQQLSPQWSATAGYSYVKVENKDGTANDYSTDLTTSQPNGYRLNLQYNQDKWDAGLTFRSATGRSLEYFTNQSFVTLDMVVNYQVTHDTRIYAKGNNLTNRAYEVRGSGVTNWMTPGGFPMAARSFYIGMEHRI